MGHPPYNDPHNPAFPVPFFSLMLLRDYKLHLIPIECTVYILLTDIDVPKAILRYDEPEPLQACAERPCQSLGLPLAELSPL